MVNIFLVGTCRIHRPFGCDLPCPSDCYTVMNLWHSENFLGPQYGTKEIIQLLDLILSTKNVPNDMKPLLFTDCSVCENMVMQLSMVKLSFAMSKVVVVEVSTIKQILKKSSENQQEYWLNLYAFRGHQSRLSTDNYTESIQTKEELCRDIAYIQNLLSKTYNKRVLFVTHFNHNNIPNRQLIIDCVKRTATHYYDPTAVVVANLPGSIIDNGEHMSREAELLVMEEMHKILNEMLL